MSNVWDFVVKFKNVPNNNRRLSSVEGMAHNNNCLQLILWLQLNRNCMTRDGRRYVRPTLGKSARVKFLI